MPSFAGCSHFAIASAAPLWTARLHSEYAFENSMGAVCPESEATERRDQMEIAAKDRAGIRRLYRTGGMPESADFRPLVYNPRALTTHA